MLAVIFFVSHAIKGNPYIDHTYIEKAEIERLMKANHLDLPLWQQFFIFLKKMYEGKVRSLQYLDLSVYDIITTSVLASLALSLYLMLFTTLLALLFTFGNVNKLILTILLSIPLPVATMVGHHFVYPHSWLKWSIMLIIVTFIPALRFSHVMTLALQRSYQKDYIKHMALYNINSVRFFISYVLKDALPHIIGYISYMYGLLISGNF